MLTLNIILGLVDKVNDWVGKILSFGILAIFALVLMEVIRRYFFNSPSVWANELTQMLFGVYAVLSGGPILRWGGHVNVDILYSHFSKRGKAVIDIVTFFAFFAFCSMLLIYGGSMALESLTSLEHTQSAWNPPCWPIKLMIPLGAILLLLQGVAKLIRDIITLLHCEDIATTKIPQKENL